MVTLHSPPLQLLQLLQSVHVYIWVCVSTAWGQWVGHNVTSPSAPLSPGPLGKVRQVPQVFCVFMCVWEERSCWSVINVYRCVRFGLVQCYTAVILVWVSYIVPLTLFKLFYDQSHKSLQNWCGSDCRAWVVVWFEDTLLFCFLTFTKLDRIHFLCCLAANNSPGRTWVYVHCSRGIDRF